MTRIRNPENRGLPARWTFKHKAYYYRVPAGQESHWFGKQMYRLASTLYEAHQEFGKRMGQLVTSGTQMKVVIDRYTHQKVPTKAKSTQRSNLISLRRIRLVFGEMEISQVASHHIFKYRDVVFHPKLTHLGVIFPSKIDPR